MSAPQPQMIFVNLPVQDLEKSKAFFTALGYSFNPTYTNDDAAGMVISESIYVMLLTHDKFREFTNTPIPDAKTGEAVRAYVVKNPDHDGELTEDSIRNHCKTLPWFINCLVVIQSCILNLVTNN